MTGNKKSLLTKLCTFSMCFFSLFSVGAATLAWFMANKTVTSRESVKTKVDDIHANYFVYKYNKNNLGTNLDESTEDENDLLTITSLTLNTYDTIFIAQNKYTPALIRIHLFGSDIPDVTNGAQNISITINRNTNFDDADILPDEETNIRDESLFKCISSAANFKAGELSNYSNYIENGDLDNISNIPNFFEAAVTHFKSGSITPQNFINEVTPTSKKDSVVLETTYSTVYHDENINHIMLFLYIDYNIDLIQNFTQTTATSLNANFLSQADTVLVNDLTSIHVTIERE